jgi:hypothetical protein
MMPSLVGSGTLLTWINEGFNAYICVITDASAGGFPMMPLT